MKKAPTTATSAASLRRQAETRRHARQADGTPRAASDPQRLLHELEIHQIELEMQNAELQRARAETETALEKYTELYDLAPVGYFSIDRQGLIQEVNLTGAALLGMVRSQLLRRPLQGFVAPASRPTIGAYLQDLFAQPGKKACEALLQTAAGAPFWADLQASSATWTVGDREWCRIAISDIAALKRGEAAQRRVESLSISMQSANREIVHRREVEASLKESERRQRELLAEAQRLHEQLRRLTHQILLAQEEERKKISRQLHDEIAQVLAGISVQLTALKATRGIDPRTLRQRIGKTRSLVAESIRVVHDFARDLRPAMLDDLGLVPTLNSFVKALCRGKKLQIGFTASPEVEVLDSTRRTVLYRVAQEALTNVLRHAHAHHATVRLTKNATAVRLAIHDDGRSFPAARLLEAQQDGRLGLLGMRERVEMVGGRFSITSTPGEGTTVTAEIPLGTAEPIAPPG